MPDSLISVCQFSKPLEWLLKKKKYGYLKEYKGKGSSFGNRQNKEKYFYPNGAIYIISTKKISQNNYYFNKSIAYEMNYIESLDIDTIQDFNLIKKII